MSDLQHQLTLLADPAADLYARLVAATSLGRSQDPAAVPALVAALADPVIGPEAIVGLGLHASAEAGAALRGEWSRRAGADPAATAAAMATRRTDELRELVVTGVALARHGDLAAADVLIAHAAAPEHGVRLEVIAGLAWFPTAAATLALVRAHDDGSDEIVERAARALASFGAIDAVPVWLDRIERGGYQGEAFARAAHELLGDAAPSSADTPTEWRRWWMRAADQYPTDRCLWMGEPASPAIAIDQLTGRDGELARAALDRWSGIDFVDDPDRNLGGDDAATARAHTWWAEHESSWQIGALYRAGRTYPLAPIAAALRSLA